MAFKIRIKKLVLLTCCLATAVRAPEIDMMHKQGSGEIDPIEGRRKPKKEGFWESLFHRRNSQDSGAGDSVTSGKGSQIRSGGRSTTPSSDDGQDISIGQKKGSGKGTKADAAAIKRVAEQADRRNRKEERSREQTDVSVKNLSPDAQLVLTRCVADFSKFTGQTELIRLKNAYEKALNNSDVSESVKKQLKNEIVVVDRLLTNNNKLEEFVRLNHEVERILDDQRLSAVQKKLVMQTVDLSKGLESVDQQAVAVRAVTADLISGIVGLKVQRRENTRFTGTHDDERSALILLQKTLESKLNDSKTPDYEKVLLEHKLKIIKRLVQDRNILNSFMNQYNKEIEDKRVKGLSR